MVEKNGCDEEMTMGGEYNLGTHTPSTLCTPKLTIDEIDSSKELGSDEAPTLP